MLVPVSTKRRKDIEMTPSPMGSIGRRRGDMWEIWTIKGPQRRVYVKWCGERCVVLARGQARTYCGFPHFFAMDHHTISHSVHTITHPSPYRE